MKTLKLKPMKKMTAAGVVVAAMMGAVAGTSYSSAQFSDISGQWFEQSVKDAAAKGYVDGFEDGTFRPNESVTRAQFMKLVAAGIGKKVETVEGNAWYMPYIKALKEEGIVEERFNPGDMNQPMVRAEMAMYAVKAVDPELKGTLLEATERGIVQGVGNGELEPMGHTTRAQAVTIIERILAAREGKELEVDKYAVSRAEIEKTSSNVNSMLGLQPQNIGQTWSLGEGASVTLNQVIVANPSDENDPYWAYIDKNFWPRNADKERDVVIMAKFTVNVDESADDNVIVYANQHLTLYDATGLLGLSEKGLDRAINFGRPGVYSGFVAYTVKREYAQNGRLTFNVVGNKVVVAD